MPRKQLRLAQKKQYALDARPDRLDLRDRLFQPRLGNLPTRCPDDATVAQWLPKYVNAKLIDDQGEDGACTGFGLASVIDYLLFVKRGEETQVSPAMLYELARLYDEWPGEDYEGSSCRGALKGWQRHGVCRKSLWPYVLKKGKRVFTPPVEDSTRRNDPDRNWDVDALRWTLGVYYRVDTRSVVDMQAALAETGALYTSGTVHEGWALRPGVLESHEKLARIEHVPKPKDGGGHAFALVGYNEWGFVVQNSWGTGWGSKGFAVLPYEDWVMHGNDAWVFTLGTSRFIAAPKRRGSAKIERSPRFFTNFTDAAGAQVPDGPKGPAAAGDAVSRRYLDVPADDRPIETEDAYGFAIVLDRGFPVRNDITAEDPAAALDGAALRRPLAWMRRRRTNKLLIYAHGGLNSESGSIARIRAIAPYALNAGIYPIFVTWRSGALETVSDLVEEWFAKLGFGARGAPPASGWTDLVTDRTDRMLESTLRSPGSALWGQMKLNAERASTSVEGGMRLMVERLRVLAKERPSLEIHLIGHSAGAIVLGALLKPLADAGLEAVTLRLFAPACTVRFALDHYRPAVEAATVDPKRWLIHVLSDANERDDSVGPYRKSLLYLVSRSFEDAHKMPILGMDACFDPATATPNGDDQWSPDYVGDVRDWCSFWAQRGVGRNRLVLSAHNVPTGSGVSIKSAHGCFDNAIDIMGDALGYIVNPTAPKRVPIAKLDY